MLINFKTILKYSRELDSTAENFKTYVVDIFQPHFRLNTKKNSAQTKKQEVRLMRDDLYQKFLLLWGNFKVEEKIFQNQLKIITVRKLKFTIKQRGLIEEKKKLLQKITKTMDSLNWIFVTTLR